MIESMPVTLFETLPSGRKIVNPEALRPEIQRCRSCFKPIEAVCGCGAAVNA